MANQGSPRVSDQTRSSSLIDLVTTAVRLLPLQLKDELAMVKGQMGKKGITAGIGVGLAVVGLVFLFITVVSLIVAMIGGFAQDRPIWFSALMVAAGALVVALIFILIGLLRVKAAMPLVPAETIQGVKYDIGYLKEGNAFDPAEFDRLEAQRAEEKKVAAAREEERRKAALSSAAAAPGGPALRARGEGGPQVAVLRLHLPGQARSNGRRGRGGPDLSDRPAPHGGPGRPEGQRRRRVREGPLAAAGPVGCGVHGHRRLRPSAQEVVTPQGVRGHAADRCGHP